MVAVVVIMTMTGCQKTDYKLQGEQMSKQLDELCQQENGDAVLALEDSILSIQQQLVASGDTANVALFREAVKESRERNAPYIAVQRLKQGVPSDTIVNQVRDEVMNGNMSIDAVTAVIDAMLQASQETK